MRRIVRSVALVVVALATAASAGAHTLAFAASSAMSAPAAGSVGIRLVDIPTDSAKDPRARQYIVDDNLNPATTIHRRVEVSNTSARTLRVAVYPDAASITGGAFIGAPGHTKNELSTWTSVSRPVLDIAAGSTATDTVTITIPPDASPSERYAVIWAEVVGAGTGNITLVSRVGIRMYIAVGGNNPPATNFTVDTMTAQRDPTGRAVVQAQVHNTGGRALDLSGTLTLVKATGAVTAGPYRVKLGTTLAPGQSEPVTVALTDDVTDGPWDATLKLNSGLLHKTYSARLTFPRHAGTTPGVVARTATGGTSALPYLIIGIAVAMLVALAGGIIVLRRRRTSVAVPPSNPAAASPAH